MKKILLTIGGIALLYKLFGKKKKDRSYKDKMRDGASRFRSSVDDVMDRWT